ncbi:MAG: hypothetical protein SV760_01880 [Halobacteria archaeon]|nr:hypothetical protein [Halobacteria archaeon]
MSSEDETWEYGVEEDEAEEGVRGWRIVHSREPDEGEASEGLWGVVGKRGDQTVYLNADGEVQTDAFGFETKRSAEETYIEFVGHDGSETLSDRQKWGVIILTVLVLVASVVLYYVLTAL